MATEFNKHLDAILTIITSEIKECNLPGVRELRVFGRAQLRLVILAQWYEYWMKEADLAWHGRQPVDIDIQQRVKQEYDNAQDVNQGRFVPYSDSICEVLKMTPNGEPNGEVSQYVLTEDYLLYKGTWMTPEDTFSRKAEIIKEKRVVEKELVRRPLEARNYTWKIKVSEFQFKRLQSEENLRFPYQRPIIANRLGRDIITEDQAVARELQRTARKLAATRMLNLTVRYGLPDSFGRLPGMRGNHEAPYSGLFGRYIIQNIKGDSPDPNPRVTKIPAFVMDKSYQGGYLKALREHTNGYSIGAELILERETCDGLRRKFRKDNLNHPDTLGSWSLPLGQDDEAIIRNAMSEKNKVIQEWLNNNDKRKFKGVSHSVVHMGNAGAIKMRRSTSPVANISKLGERQASPLVPPRLKSLGTTANWTSNSPMTNQHIASGGPPAFMFPPGNQPQPWSVPTTPYQTFLPQGRGSPHVFQGHGPRRGGRGRSKSRGRGYALSKVTKHGRSPGPPGAYVMRGTHHYSRGDRGSNFEMRDPRSSRGAPMMPQQSWSWFPDQRTRSNSGNTDRSNSGNTDSGGRTSHESAASETGALRGLLADTTIGAVGPGSSWQSTYSHSSEAMESDQCPDGDTTLKADGLNNPNPEGSTRVTPREHSRSPALGVRRNASGPLGRQVIPKKEDAEAEFHEGFEPRRE